MRSQVASRWEVDLSAGKARRDQEAWQLFCAYLEQPRSLLLLGIVSTARFFASSRFVPAGSPINSYSTLPCKRDQHRFLVRRLSRLDDVLLAAGTAVAA